MIRAYHFVGDALRDGSAIPPDGEWLTFDGRVKICKSGLHAGRHPFDALQYAPGETLCLVECADIVDEQSDKLVCRRRRIVARIDATEVLREFARWCALQVIDLWNALPVVREYLETGKEDLRDAAGDAAGAAAWDARAAAGAAAWAARDAARAAAGDAAGDAQRTKFADAVHNEFR